MIALALHFLTHFGVAQGLVTFNTDDTQPLISQMRSLDASAPGGRLEFDFGFATEESPVAGGFLDAFSVSLQDPSQIAAAILFTADSSGLVLAPVTPGTVVLDRASITINSILYPSLQPVLPNQIAFHLSVPVPQEFAANSMNIYFDLFNNQNALVSQAWFNNVRIVTVPEPQISVLLLLSGSILWSMHRCRTRA